MGRTEYCTQPKFGNSNMSTNCASSLENGMCREKKGCALPCMLLEKRGRVHNVTRRVKRSRTKARKVTKNTRDPKAREATAHTAISKELQSPVLKKELPRGACAQPAHARNGKRKRRARRPPAYIEEPHY